MLVNYVALLPEAVLTAGAGSFPSFRQHGKDFSDAGEMDDFAGNDADRGLL